MSISRRAGVTCAQIEGDEVVTRQSYEGAVPPLIGRGHVARFGKAVIGACQRGETVVVGDIHVDPGSRTRSGRSSARSRFKGSETPRLIEHLLVLHSVRCAGSSSRL